MTRLSPAPSTRMAETVSVTEGARFREALAGLEEVDPQAAHLVKLRVYSGFSLAEAAAALGFSTDTVQGDWAFAQAWLFRRLKSNDP